MNALTSLLWAIALSAFFASASYFVDDDACRWDEASSICMPESLCKLNFNMGDLDFDQTCRVKKGVNLYPQQIHLAFAGKKAGTAMTVSWATFEPVTDSSVWVGTSKLKLELVDTPVSSTSYYSDDEYNLFHHHATVTGLKPHTKYFYKVGCLSDDKYTSDISSFVTARPATDNSSFSVLIYGDLGDGKYSADTIASINNLTSHDIDLVYHLGDISYADNDYLTLDQAAGFFYEEVYNKWMNALMPLMSRVPYMVLPGNHEAECHSPRCMVSREKRTALGNYAAYNTRFKMPSEESGGALNMWHSFDHGPIHFTSLSTETDYPNAPTNQFARNKRYGGFGDQLKWIEADLKKANKNRDKVPWIFVGMHRPIYSVLDSKSDVPIGQTLAVQAAFEELLLRFKVDVVLTGHKHYYERQLPTAKNKAVMDGVSSKYTVYDNPKAPVHIITGGAGQSEGMSVPPTHNASWNAVNDYEHFGYTILHANHTTLLWKYVSSADHSILDQFAMLKTDAVSSK
uniref:Purple acid phosphatase n=1 Tax=Peronospora matthiolae TaxID=2874970 RepID=A0AAV1UFB2_9STRA